LKTSFLNGTIGLIKAANTFRADKNISSPYASRASKTRYLCF
jgi:hypothetical protein